jgi:hypothetical protein
MTDMLLCVLCVWVYGGVEVLVLSWWQGCCDMCAEVG